MPVRKWGLVGVATLMLMLAAMVSPAAASPKSTGKEDLQASMAKLLAANPGAKQVSANRIEFDNGVFIVRLTAGDVAPTGGSTCRSGEQCGFIHIDFGGYGIGAPRCVYVDYYQYFWYHDNGVRDDFAFDVTSIHNNIPGVAWSQFWSPRNNANYNAAYGWPAPYVGAQWNDSFTAAQGCVGDPA